MRPVATAFGVSRSALQAAAKHSPSTRTKPVIDDSVLLDRIRQVVAERPSYGYRFVTAMLNGTVGAARVNHKRVYRVMREHGLLLARHTGRPTLRHDGKVMTLKSNLRWCSDGFEIRCWNDEKVHVVFALDCCDREVMGYQASTSHPTGETIRDLMAECVEARFGAGVVVAPHPLEWLSDNGPPFVCRRPRDPGLRGAPWVSRRQHARNGMADSFVKTFKRDYVYLKRRPDAATVLSQLAVWFDDYNEIRPHSSLGMRSPRAFRRRQEAA